MEQVESLSFPSNTTTKSTPCITRDGIHVVQVNLGPANKLVLLPKSRKSDALNISSTIASSSTSHESISRSFSSDISSASDTEEEMHSVVEMDGTSDTHSEEAEVGVKKALNIAMDVFNGLLLRELLDYASLKATDATGGCGSSNSGSHVGIAGSSTSSNLSSRTSSSQVPEARKRMRGNGCDPGDGDESDNDDRPMKKNDKGPPGRPPHRRLKCPFYQREPGKYIKAACRGQGFADMGKLKDHIKRVHTQPLRCIRCWLDMESENAYSEHILQEIICKKKEKPQEDRIPLQMLKQLDFKKVPYANARNTEEKWTMMFRVLFPNDTNIPSPCKSSLLIAAPSCG